MFWIWFYLWRNTKNKKALMISITFWEDLTFVFNLRNTKNKKSPGDFYYLLGRPHTWGCLSSRSSRAPQLALWVNYLPSCWPWWKFGTKNCVLTCSICRGWFHSRETDLLTVRQWRTPWKQNIASIQIIKNENFWNLYLTNQNDDIQKFTEKESISIPKKFVVIA